jgi:hypothetical protein
MRDVIALEDAARTAGNDLSNLRTQPPAMAVRRSRVADFLRRMAQAFREFPGGEPSNWRDAAVFCIGAVWGGMILFGILAAIAARHAP